MQSLELDQETYDHLRKLAARIFAERGKGKEDTLQPTALLHEAWVKLVRSSSTYESKAHFNAVAAKAMRQIMVDRARARIADKRGGRDLRRTTLQGIPGLTDDTLDVMAIDEALDALKELDAAAAQLVVLRVFGGLTMPEIAEVEQTSLSTVERRWRFARAFLARKLTS